MAAPNSFKPSTIPGLWAAAMLGGAAFGASSSLVPYVKLNALVLIGVLVILALQGAGLTRGFVVNLIAALIAGALAVVAMWAVWFGFEHGWPHLYSLIRQGPAAIESTIRHLGTTTTYRVTTGSTAITHDPPEVRLLWLVETGVMLAAPVLGSLFSPMINRRRAASAT